MALVLLLDLRRLLDVSDLYEKNGQEEAEVQQRVALGDELYALEGLAESHISVLFSILLNVKWKELIEK